MGEDIIVKTIFYEFRVYGVVQGVGFRPFIYKLAKDNNLNGNVRNEGGYVRIIVNDKDFDKKIQKNPPPLSDIERIEKYDTKEVHNSFVILESKDLHESFKMPSDIFMCEDCLRELNDPTDRRFGYYFVTCTNCGPRFSMIKDSPYDRENTSMDEFRMCKECEIEYTDPNNRRYHAQTTACKNCGPRLKFVNDNKNLVINEDKAIAYTIEKLKQEKLVSVKGVGGFHIVCKIKGVKRLREFTGRSEKPFALMAKNIEQIKKYCQVSKKEEELLKSKERPIVLLEKKNKLLDDVSELSTLGFMLPYTALHYLLLDKFDEPLIFTSNNLPDEPIEADFGLTHYILDHDRKILNKVDDSIIKVIDEKPLFLRRARGYTPTIIDVDGPDQICLGAEMNSSFVIVKDKKAYVSQYLGNTANEFAFDNYRFELHKWLAWLRPDIKKVMCDEHPNYNTSKYAKELASRFEVPLVKVQHHTSHLNSIRIKQGFDKFIGISFDGTGYGDEKTIYGGEIFFYDGKYKRIGSVERQKLIGGDSGTKTPRKILFGILRKFMKLDEIKKLDMFDDAEIKLIDQQIKSGFNLFDTTSVGRMLDAATALIGRCNNGNTYDGRCAMLLESRAKNNPLKLNPLIEEKRGLLKLSTTHLFKFLIDNLDKDKQVLASTVLHYIADGFIEIIEKINKDNLPVVFSGGVSYNKIIAKKFFDKGYITNHVLPCGDGNISFGQIQLN